MKRMDCAATAPKALNILFQQEKYLHQQFAHHSVLNPVIWELVKIRVSQINQCAFCIDMHSKDALKQGEKPERIWGLNAWKDMPFYSETEQAAIQWAETVTMEKTISDQQYLRAEKVFGDGLVDLTVAINAINSWNRVAKVFKPEVGAYQP